MVSFHARQLNRRARDSAVGAVDTAIAGSGFQRGTTARAFVKVLAAVGRHDLDHPVATRGTGQLRIQFNGRHGYG